MGKGGDYQTFSSQEARNSQPQLTHRFYREYRGRIIQRRRTGEVGRAGKTKIERIIPVLTYTTGLEESEKVTQQNDRGPKRDGAAG